MSALRAALLGASGRMGRAVARVAHEQGIEIACAIGLTEVGRDMGELAGLSRSGVAVTRDPSALARAGVNVVVDFSLPAATRALAPIASSAGIAIVSGTTGLDAETLAALDLAAKRVPVLWEPNMSVGVHVLGALLERAIAMLGEDIDLEMVEMHHGLKVDAPSGTAVRLAEIAQRARRGSVLAHGRQGRPGARPKGEIGMHAVRGGDVIGDHTAYLLGQGERIELVHRASSRDLFARGALRAARWIQGRPAGRYGLVDVLG